MKTRIVLLVAVLGCVGDTRSAPRSAHRATIVGGSEYVGLRYATPPSGLEKLDGAVVEHPDVPGHGGFAVAIIQAKHGTVLWLDSAVARNERGQVAWQVMASAPLPDYGQTEVLVIANCYRDGARDEEIVALARYEKKPRYTSITKAWRASRVMHTISPIPTRGIECENEGYGT